MSRSHTVFENAEVRCWHEGDGVLFLGLARPAAAHRPAHTRCDRGGDRHRRSRVAAARRLHRPRHVRLRVTPPWSIGTFEDRQAHDRGR